MKCLENSGFPVSSSFHSDGDDSTLKELRDLFQRFSQVSLEYEAIDGTIELKIHSRVFRISLIGVKKKRKQKTITKKFIILFLSPPAKWRKSSLH